MIFAHKSDYPRYGLNFKSIANLNFKGKTFAHKTVIETF